MKHIERLLCVSAFLLLPLGSIAQEWPELTQNAKPAARWWWLGSAVDEANLSYNMEEYARAGLGELEITPIYGVQNNEDNELSFLTPEWMKALEYAIDKGKEVGMCIDMSTPNSSMVGSNWEAKQATALRAKASFAEKYGHEPIVIPVVISDGARKLA